MSRLIFFLTIFLLPGCAKPLPEITEIDLQQWKADRHGCNGYRENTSETFLNQKEKLLGLSENQILKLIGKPDAAELYKRNQKFYYYALSADSTCNSPSGLSKKLSLRFNATGLVKEVTTE
ncbi:MAG: hypothetical protein N2044_05170 [Cyclobacteriaceae bacterium]|nr:hypothetical protein [Cyclobacteriaceae bacterium]MCX7637221.1 hypothetical protein [Cyclobacteriaceae bacterium]MDW8332085.1 hypothetical protein [Cyclobacteriaceae bacterium]